MLRLFEPLKAPRASRIQGAPVLRPKSIHRPPAEQKLDDACRRLLDCCLRMDQRLTTAEIIAALVQTSAAEIAADAYRNNLDVLTIANGYCDLLRSSITALEGDMRSKSQKWK